MLKDPRRILEKLLMKCCTRLGVKPNEVKNSSKHAF